MQFGSLQSRLVASLAASAPVVLLFLFLISSNLATAQVSNHDALPVRMDGGDDDITGLGSEEAVLGPRYASQFDAFDRSILGTISEDVTESLANNAPRTVSLRPGATAYFVFEEAADFGTTRLSNVAARTVEEKGSGEGTEGQGTDGQRRDGQGARGAGKKAGNGTGPMTDMPLRKTSSRKVFLSANTCKHPEPPPLASAPADAPQLAMYISTSEANTFPGPGGNSADKERPIEFVEGAVMQTVNATGAVFFSVYAPAVVPADLGGEWTFEIAASVDGYYHSYDTAPSQLALVDSDANSALLRTRDLGLADVPAGLDLATTRVAMQEDPAYVVFVSIRGSPRLNGIRRSFCGLHNYAEMAIKDGNAAEMVTVSAADSGRTQTLKQQFHFRGLVPGSGYTSILVHTGRKSLAKRTEAEAGGGGRVFEARQFETKTGDNCKIITDLEFCQGINYAVPANENKFNNSALAQFYDDYARKMYRFFENNLAQIACDAQDDSRYSLVRNCADCEAAYRTWLCSVTIPRCEDFTSANSFAIARNVAQPFPNGSALAPDLAEQFQSPGSRASRNAVIDEQIAPGPYREVLPCDTVCHQLVRSCPAALKFTCPTHGMYGYNTSYGRLEDGGGAGGVSCSLADTDQDQSGGYGVSVSWISIISAAAFASALCL